MKLPDKLVVASYNPHVVTSGVTASGTALGNFNATELSAAIVHRYNCHEELKAALHALLNDCTSEYGYSRIPRQEYREQAAAAFDNANKPIEN